MSSYPPELQVERAGGVGRIWLNRPEKRNAITTAMRSALGAAVEELDAAPDVRMIVIRGRGGTFCAGADLGRVQGDMAESDTVDRIAQGSRILTDLAAATTPTLAVVEGYATAGGFEIMLACDFAIAADDARIGDFHIRRGLVAGAGPLYRLPRLVGLRRAKELMMSGRLLDTDEALRWGLLNRACSAGDLDKVVDDFVADFVDKSPSTMRATKRALDRSLETDVDTMRVIERLTVAEVFTSEDAREGVLAFLEKRSPKWSEK
jgi:enoyl-CoA hydratase/carnithine racemase